MSFTSIVPAGVPSVFHSSAPAMPSVAAKSIVPFKLMKPFGEEELGHEPYGLELWPGKMSLTSTVPPDVPSVFHSSRPFASTAENSTPLVPNGVKELGDEPVAP